MRCEDHAALALIPTTVEAVAAAEAEMEAGPPVVLPERLRDPWALLRRWEEEAKAKGE